MCVGNEQAKRASRLAGLPIRLLGLAELATQPVQLGLLVEHRTGNLRLAGEKFTRPLRLAHRLRPRAVQLHHLGSIHQTLTAKGNEVGLRVTPVAQRSRPLLRAAKVEDLLASCDYRAIGDPHDDRGHLSGGDRHHDLVEPGHTFSDLSQIDQALPPAEPGERHQVRIAEALADLAGPIERGVRGRDVSLGHGLERNRHKNEALLHAVELFVIEQPPGSGEPPATPGHLAPVE